MEERGGCFTTNNRDGNNDESLGLSCSCDVRHVRCLHGVLDEVRDVSSHLVETVCASEDTLIIIIDDSVLLWTRMRMRDFHQVVC